MCKSLLDDPTASTSYLLWMMQKKLVPTVVISYLLITASTKHLGAAQTLPKAGLDSRQSVSLERRVVLEGQGYQTHTCQQG